MLKLVLICSIRGSSVVCRHPCLRNVRLCSNININETESLFADYNKFGTLSLIKEDTSHNIDEGDAEEEKYLSEKPIGTQPTTKQYADKIKGFIRVNKLKEAFDVVEVELIQENRAKPCNYLYNLLIGACGRVGYTKKAFQLYNQMKNRALVATGGTYTALFNACANSPWAADGLTRALHLKDLIQQNGYVPNDSNYNAMIKAFGRCGDLETAFSIVDEMMEKRIPLQTSTFNFLLQGCISDKESGFRHALLVWQKMHRKGIRPDTYSFALMLKCAQDCGTGDPNLLRDTIRKVVTDVNQPKCRVQKHQMNEVAALSLNENCVDLDNVNSKTVIDNCQSAIPNLLTEAPHLGNVIEISEIKEAKDRLLLLGGQRGLLETMERFGVQPTIKTITQLLMIIPNTNAAEKNLLSLCKDYKIELDLEFYNMLIKKRAFRQNYQSALAVLLLIDKSNLQPDLITYGVLAIACTTREEAEHQICLMVERGYRLNTEILGAMLRQACHHYDFGYIYLIFETVITENIRVSQRFLDILSEFQKNAMNTLQANKGKPKAFKEKFKKFKSKYEIWLSEVQREPKTDEVHPWTQYRQNSDTKVNTAIKNRINLFKPKHNSYFKQPKGSVKNIKQLYSKNNSN